MSQFKIYSVSKDVLQRLPYKKDNLIPYIPSKDTLYYVLR